jgi:phytoene desaturase
MKIHIIGAGIGGLSCAAVLAKNGFEVVVLEQNDYFGGKANRISEEGFEFDTGPSLLTYPDWFDELFISCGKNPRDYYKFQRLNLITRYFVSNKVVDVMSDIEETADNFENKFGLNKKDFLKYINKWIRIYNISEKIFLLKELKFNLLFFKNAIKWLFSTGFSNILQSMSSYNRRLENKYVEPIMNRFATYTGSSPYKTPAFMNQLAIVEMINGGYYPEDGIHSIPKAIYKLCLEMGVQFVFNAKIDEIKYERQSFNISSGAKSYKSSVVISNVDYYHTQFLFNRKVNTSYSKLSTSAIVFYWGVKINSDKLKLHNILFSKNYENEFSQIFEQGILPDDPTIYINITSKINSQHAPKDCENWFVMVNTPANLEIDNQDNIEKIKKVIIKKIEEKIGENLSKLIIYENILTPKSLSTNTGSYLGSLYGDNQNSLNAIVNRKKNTDPNYNNLYYVGGTVHPGGGMPLALRSGINVAKKIINES